MPSTSPVGILPQPYLPPAAFVRELPVAERRKRIVIVAGRCADPVELTRPLNVFQIANQVLAISGKPELGYDLEIVSSIAGTIYEATGLKITADKEYFRVRGNVHTLNLHPNGLQRPVLGGRKISPVGTDSSG